MPPMIDSEFYVFGMYETVGVCLCDCQTRYGKKAPAPRKARAIDMFAPDCTGYPTPVLRLCDLCAPKQVEKVYRELTRQREAGRKLLTRQELRWERRRASPMRAVPAHVSLDFSPGKFDRYEEAFS